MHLCFPCLNYSKDVDVILINEKCLVTVIKSLFIRYWVLNNLFDMTVLVIIIELTHIRQSRVSANEQYGWKSSSAPHYPQCYMVFLKSA